MLQVKYNTQNSRKETFLYKTGNLYRTFEIMYKDGKSMEKNIKKNDRKIDRRTLYTRNVIKNALLEALGEKSFDQITITEICKRAEITRATYYLHYSSLTDVLDELLFDAMQMAQRDCDDANADELQVLKLLADKQPKQLEENESMLPVCHRVAQLPKYQVIFRDESISGYVVNRIYQCQKHRLVPVFMKSLHLTKKSAEMLTLFVITGTYNVNKALNWKKDNTWYQIHSMLLKFSAGGYTRLEEIPQEPEDQE